jgi:hypothetical protein
MEISKGVTDKIKMKTKIKTSHPCMKMKISKGGTKKKGKKMKKKKKYLCPNIMNIYAVHKHVMKRR